MHLIQNFKTILKLIFIVNVSFVYSQNVSTTIQIGDGSRIRTIQKVGDSGFLIYSYQVAKYGTLKKSNASIKYFDTKLNQRWEYQPNDEDKAIDYGFFVTSNNTQYVYNIYNEYVLGSGKTSTISPSATTRINILRLSHQAKQRGNRRMLRKFRKR
jgi:hypothetical protein